MGNNSGSTIRTGGSGSIVINAPSNTTLYFNRDTGNVNTVFQSGGTVTFTGGAVGVGTASPNAAAALQVFSATQGFLPPQVTIAGACHRDEFLDRRLDVYNTSLHELDVYNDQTGVWEAVGAYAVDAAGSTGQVQFNNGGDLAANANFFWNNSAAISASAPMSSARMQLSRSMAAW